MNIPIYCLSYNNPVRCARMKNRFKSLEIDDVTFSPGMKDDISARSIMLGHMDILRRFCERDDAEYAVFCEDDIYIHKDLKTHLPIMVQECKVQNIDILLMGYLFRQNVSQIQRPGYTDIPHLHKGEYCDYFGFPDLIWGAQMYMLSKEKAREFVNKDPHDYGEIPYAADWTLTKLGNRALTVPMYAVEDGTKHYDHDGQQILHHETFHNNINDDYV